MPVVLRYRGYRFFFYSNEGSPREPIHIHVLVTEGEAKFCLHPEPHLADSEGFNASTLRELLRVVASNVELIENSWHEHFS